MTTTATVDSQKDQCRIHLERLVEAIQVSFDDGDIPPAVSMELADAENFLEQQKTKEKPEVFS